MSAFGSLVFGPGLVRGYVHSTNPLRLQRVRNDVQRLPCDFFFGAGLDCFLAAGFEGAGFEGAGFEATGFAAVFAAAVLLDAVAGLGFEAAFAAVFAGGCAGTAGGALAPGAAAFPFFFAAGCAVVAAAGVPGAAAAAFAPLPRLG